MFYRKVMKDRKIISDEEITAIFGDVANILRFHQTLLIDMRYRIQMWHPNQKFADLFIKVMSYFKVYTTYVNNVPVSNKTLLDCRSRGPVNRFLEIQQKKAMKKTKISVPLELLLPMPFQRLMKYELFFKDLLKKTWMQHPDYRNIEKAIKGFTEVVSHVDKRRGEYEQKSKKLRVNSKLQSDDAIFGSTRQDNDQWYFGENDMILKEGMAEIDGGIKQLYLFQNEETVKLLILRRKQVRTKQKMLFGTMRFDVTANLDLAEYKLTEYDADCFLVLENPEAHKKKWRIKLQTVSEKKSWYNSIAKEVKDLKPASKKPLTEDEIKEQLQSLKEDTMRELRRGRGESNPTSPAFTRNSRKSLAVVKEIAVEIIPKKLTLPSNMELYDLYDEKVIRIVEMQHPQYLSEITEIITNADFMEKIDKGKRPITPFIIGQMLPTKDVPSKRSMKPLCKPMLYEFLSSKGNEIVRYFKIKHSLSLEIVKKGFTGKKDNNSVYG
eukprot:CAMPEP_0168514204 /NCGR_PEP_ID=MMETSP0405-20121227/3959_1 /TAXON_ID=498012 /ORGANISM="Trichosphaerium sp, Strain Am-I-7 wt" /LENGTH=494 /DNA_ID=CAMNT_0008533263 /DNA_START=204 /DNA_END=1684 /DNA_ORIENTATION=+